MGEFLIEHGSFILEVIKLIILPLAWFVFREISKARESMGKLTNVMNEFRTEIAVSNSKMEDIKERLVRLEERWN